MFIRERISHQSTIFVPRKERDQRVYCILIALPIYVCLTMLWCIIIYVTCVLFFTCPFNILVISLLICFYYVFCKE